MRRASSGTARVGALLGAALLAAAPAGCGYGFAVGGPGLPEGIGQVYVPVFDNRSTDAEAGALFSEALATALARQGRAAGPGAAARIDGRVVALSANPVATAPDGTREAALYRLTATVQLRLVREGRELCVREVDGGEDFLPARDLLGLEASRRQALRRLAERLMESASRGLCPLEAGR